MSEEYTLNKPRLAIGDLPPATTNFAHSRRPTCNSRHGFIVPRPQWLDFHLFDPRLTASRNRERGGHS
jgi:hypothetical protein